MLRRLIRALPVRGRVRTRVTAAANRTRGACAPGTVAARAVAHRRFATACPAAPTPVASADDAKALADRDALLPSSVTVIRDASCEYYLLGTVHSNATSKQHISDVLDAVKPDVVVLELEQRLPGTAPTDPSPAPPPAAEASTSTSPSATAAAGVSAAAVEANDTPVNWDVVWWHVRRGEFVFAFLAGFGRGTAARLAMSGLTEMLHAERQATARSVPVIRADRPFHITFARLFRAVGWRARLHLLRNILRPPPQPDFAAVKYDDVVAALRERDGLLFPGLAQNVMFMAERDIAFVHALQSSVSDWSVDAEGRRKRVVGIFGAAHIAGISKWWNKAQLVDYDAVMSESRPDKFDISALWLELYGSRFAIGCGRCKQLAIDYPANTIVQNCQAPDPNTGVCSRDPRVTGAANDSKPSH